MLPNDFLKTKIFLELMSVCPNDPVLSSRAITFLTHVKNLVYPKQERENKIENQFFFWLGIQNRVDRYLRDVAGEVASFEEYLAKKPGRVCQNVKTAFEIKAAIEKAFQRKATQADKDAAVRSIYRLKQ